MMRITMLVFALALGVAWSAAVPPVVAGDTAEKAAELKDKASDAARDATERLKSMGEKVKEKAVDVKDDVKAKVRGGEDSQAGGGSVDVRQAQEALRAQGFDPGAIDGVMGRRTSAAVRDFQQQNGLPVTGRLDRATASRLGLEESTVGGDAPGASPATTPK